MLDINKKISVGTTFNKRIFEARRQNGSQSSNIFWEMKEKYPEVPFYAYHENSFEKEKYNESIDFDVDWDGLNLYDVFEVNKDWIEDFINDSPLKDCHKITNSEYNGHGSNNYWNRNAIYWFRKIAAIKHCIEQVDTDHLLWVGCDTMIGREFDEQLFSYIEDYDSSLIIRAGQSIESDVTLFNFKKRGKAIIEYWIDMFLSQRAFKERRWDDGYILEITRRHLDKDYSFGNLRGEWFDIYKYILHYKGTNVNLRKNKPGI